MHESIFKSFLRRFFLILATIFGIFFAFMLAGAFSSAFFESSDNAPTIKSSLSAQIEPNAKGVRELLSSKSPVILNVKIDGIIGGESLDRDSIAQQLLESREGSFKNDRVKGILLTINSPGGTVTDADSIYHAIKTYKETYKVPVYAFIDGLCASGGMYIACSADKIYATNASIIGSIGVITPPAFNVTNLMAKAGLESKTLHAGKDKDELNPFRPWGPNEGQNYQMVIDYFYNVFVNIVTTNRPEVNKSKLVEEYGANIFPAPQAKEIGYVDSDNATYREVLTELAEKIGLHDDEYQVVTLKSESWLQSLFKAQSPMNLLSGQVKHTIEFPGQLDTKLSGKYLYFYEP